MSPRALANVGARRYLVLDFDEGDKDDHATIIWHLREKWQQITGLVMVLDSGNKSLHGWWDVNTCRRRPSQSSAGLPTA